MQVLRRLSRGSSNDGSPTWETRPTLQEPEAPHRSLRSLLSSLLEACSQPSKSAVQQILEATGESERMPQLCGQCFELLFHDSYAAWAASAAAVTQETCMPGSGSLSRFRSAPALTLLLELLPLMPLELARYYLATMQGLLDRSTANAEFAATAGVAARLLRWLRRSVAEEEEAASAEAAVGQEAGSACRSRRPCCQC